MTPQEETELRKWEAKFQYSPFLGVTVYDGQFSEVRWWDDGQENVVWSNVNFLHFAPMGDLETDTSYFWIMLCGSETTSEQVRALNAEAASPLEITALPPKSYHHSAKLAPNGWRKGNCRRQRNGQWRTFTSITPSTALKWQRSTNSGRRRPSCMKNG